uniref:Uncharacterized protein n=1 Tax=Solanum lycopersicum TaxID=4081 RepID=K4CCR2_SOLLC
MRCATQRLALSPLLLFWLCHYQSRVTPGPAAPDLRRTIILMTKQGSASYFSSYSSTIPTSNFLGVGASKLTQPSKGGGSLECQNQAKRWLFFLGLSNQRMPIPPLMTPSRESLNFPMWIERKLGMDIDPSAYPECWKYSNVFLYFLFPDHWKQSSLAQGSPHSNLHYDRNRQ